MTEQQKIVMSPAELEQVIETAVTKAKVDALMAEFDEHEKQEALLLKEIGSDIKDIRENLGSWEMKLNTCRNELEADIYKELEDHYITKKDLDHFEAKLEPRLEQFAKQFKWTMGGVLAVFTAAGFVIQMLYVSSQLTKAVAYSGYKAAALVLGA